MKPALLAMACGTAGWAATPATALECEIQVQCLGTYPCVRENGWGFRFEPDAATGHWTATDSLDGSTARYVPLRERPAPDGTLFLVLDDEGDSNVTLLTLQPGGAVVITGHSAMPEGLSSSFFGHCKG
jgi:hypothetical protein